MDIEEIFWSQIDPFYHLKQASCIRYAKDINQHYRLDGFQSADANFENEILDGMDEMRASALMFIRFHAIETLLTVLLGGYPHGPVPRFAKKFFGQKFNSIVQAISKKEIPEQLKFCGITDYNDWITAKFWGRFRTDISLNEEIINFISVQADLFGQKSLYNAFKHGCRIGRSCPKVSFQDKKSGEWHSVMEIESGVSWLEWEEDKQTRRPTVTLGVMSCNPSDDHGAIAIMAILVRALKTIRLAKPGDNIHIELPNECLVGTHTPNNFRLKMNF